MKYTIVAIILVFLAAFYVISTYNTFVSLKNRINEAFSTMDVFLLKRSELIPNLVATVKGYARYEGDTLERVVNARNRALKSADEGVKLEAESELTDALNRLLALAESYPDLKANQNFLSLQSDLKEMESEVADARRYYNGVVRQYNTMQQTIPSRFVAKAMGLKPAAMFTVKDEQQRKNVKVEF